MFPVTIMRFERPRQEKALVILAREHSIELIGFGTVVSQKCILRKVVEKDVSGVELIILPHKTPFYSGIRNVLCISISNESSSMKEHRFLHWKLSKLG